MEEVADVDRHRPSGLKDSDPVILRTEEIHRLGDIEPPSDDEELDEVIHEFTQDRYPEGPKCGVIGEENVLSDVLPPEQMNDLNDILFAMCEELADKLRDKGPLTKADLPRLREEWKTACANILMGAPAKLPPLREINHQIPLVDEKKRYNYHLPKCPDSMRKPLAEKIDAYCKAEWWCPTKVEQAAPMLAIPKKNRSLRTVVNTQKRNTNTVKDVTPFPDQDMICLDVA